MNLTLVHLHHYLTVWRQYSRNRLFEPSVCGLCPILLLPSLSFVSNGMSDSAAFSLSSSICPPRHCLLLSLFLLWLWCLSSFFPTNICRHHNRQAAVVSFKAYDNGAIGTSIAIWVVCSQHHVLTLPPTDPHSFHHHHLLHTPRTPRLNHLTTKSTSTCSTGLLIYYGVSRIERIFICKHSNAILSSWTLMLVSDWME